MPSYSTFITPDESEFIRFLLILRGRPQEVKAGLQRLCALYEGGKRLIEPHEHCLLVRALLLDSSVMIRRWAYKAIAWLGNQEDVDTLTSRLRDEDDFENQTWAMAAIIALAKDEDVATMCALSGQPTSVPFLLAARLFAQNKWLRDHPDTPIIDIDRADGLTLKWAALLSGYGRAPPNLFHPRCDNRELLGRLNSHPEPEVSEYSVWALWQNPNYAVGDMTIEVQDVGRHPKNVRRWINRLITKPGSHQALNLDLVDDLRRDAELVAREGLALGLRQIYIPGLGKHMLDWHSSEAEEILRELLLEHMASYANFDPDYALLVEESFKRAGPDSGIRKRLLAASVQQPLHAVLKGIAARQRAAEEGILQPSFNLNTEKVVMTTFSAGRDISGQNLVGGDMINSANAAVQQLAGARETERKTLEDMLRYLSETKDIGEEGKQRIASAVQAVAEKNSPESKKRLVSTLTEVASAVGVVTSIATKLHDFAHVVSGWF